MNIGSRDMKGGANNVDFHGNQTNVFGNQIVHAPQTPCEIKGKSPTLDRCQLLGLENSYCHEVGWMHPLPWDQSVRFPPEDYYIELDLDIYDRTGKYVRSEKTQVEDLFDSIVKGGNHPAVRVLVRGDAGFGKTTLCAKTAYDWSQGVTTFRAKPCETTLPICYKLRHLKEGEKLEDVVFSLIRSVYHKDVGNAELELILKSLGRNLLLILDGFDEVEEAIQKQVKAFVSFKNKDSLFVNASFLVTSRPTEEDDFLSLFDKHFIIRSISEDKVERIVAAFQKHLPSTSDCSGSQITFQSSLFPKTRQLEDLITKKSGKEFQLKNLNPLTISLTCWLVVQKGFLYENKDVIYECMLFLCKRCNTKGNFRYGEEEIEDALWILGALVHLSHRKTFIETVKLEDCLDTRKVKFLTLAGILKFYKYKEYEPVHKSFFDTLVERVCDRSLKCLPEGKELRLLLRWRCRPELHLSCGAGRCEKTQLILDIQDSILVYDLHENIMTCTKSRTVSNDFQPVVIKIRFVDTAVNISLDDMPRDCCDCLKCLIMRRMNYYMVFLRYALADDASETTELLFCPDDRSVLSWWLNTFESISLEISVDERTNIQRTWCHVAEKLFGVFHENSSDHLSGDSHIRSVANSLRKDGWKDLKIRLSFRDGSEASITCEDSQDSKYEWNGIQKILVSLSRNRFVVDSRRFRLAN